MSFLLTVGVTALELLRPWPIKMVLDEVLLADNGRGLWGLTLEQSIIAAALGLLVISVALGMMNTQALVLGAKIGRAATVSVRKRLFGHLHRLALPFHDSSRTGDLLTRLIGDVNMVRDMLFASWVDLLGRLMVFVGAAVLMLILDAQMALLALAPAPLLLIALNRSSSKLRSVTRKQRRREGDAAALAAETLRQIRVVKAYAGEGAATERFAIQTGFGEQAGVKATRISAQMNQVTEVLTGAGLALVLFAGARQVLAGSLTPGELVVFVTYARTLYKPLRGLSKQGGRLSKAVACSERLLEVLHMEPEDTTGAPAPPFFGRITFQDVHYSYPGGVKALDGVSFDIEASRLVVVAGPNGSGKSTTLSLLLRLITPDSGHILIDGKDIRSYGLESYRARFAYVPQQPLLFGASIRENILYGRADASDEEVRNAATLAFLSEMIEALPEGYNTMLGEDGASLSGGEARRLMLARAAVRNARILLLDEPLAGLDPKARTEVAAAIRTISTGRTTLVVSHDVPTELAPDALLELRNGRVVGSVSPPWMPDLTGGSNGSEPHVDVRVP